MASSPDPSPEILQLWRAVTESIGNHKRPSQTYIEETILFHGSAPKYYVLSYSLSKTQWVSTPLLCRKFSRLRRNLTPDSSMHAFEIADAWLTRIEFAGVLVQPLQKHRIRQALLKLQLSSEVAVKAFTEIGIRQKRGQIKLLRQPRWCYWAARITRDLLTVAAAVTMITALRPIVTDIALPPGSFTLFLMTLVMSWMATIAEAFGPGWAKAEKIRHLIGLQCVFQS